MPNRLSKETSPYLRQHAENPVDWYPWGPEALERSRVEDRPILLSVGYSSCHWCHVMERESFEDPSTASLMNELFINVKVDREERPDIDQIYMKAVQAMTGRGGWPMTVFLTPDRIPFFGGTYYPPEPRPGMPSFSEVLRAVADAWDHRREDVHAGSSRLLEALRQTSLETDSGANADTLDRAYAALERQFDPTFGGFGRAPKFPQPVTLELLIRHYLRTRESRALEMAVHTLRRMAAGGIRDHLGGGFHRYSVDERWLVPHFEKMLYDNALLATAYLDAYRVTGSDDLKEIAIETLDYMAADLRSPEGGFYAARDADSEGAEGLFYVWTPTEVEEVLGEADARLFSRVYDISVGGNFEGRSIPHLPHELEAVAASEDLPAGALEAKMEAARASLLERRATREHPFRDEKIIVSWNGLAIRAFAEAGAALGNEDYVSIATGAAEFVSSHLMRDGRLLRSWMEGEAIVGGFLEDYGSFGNALLSLHAATLEPRWLEAAIWLADQVLERFWVESDGAVYDTADDAEELILRPRDPMDNATPSGPSLAAELLARVGRLTGNDRYLSIAQAIIDRDATALERYGPAFGRMLTVLDGLLAEPMEIVIVGEDNATTDTLVRAAHEDVLPGAVVAGFRPSDPPEGPVIFQGRGADDGAPTAYVCSGFACKLPVTKAEAMREQIREVAGR